MLPAVRLRIRFFFLSGCLVPFQAMLEIALAHVHPNEPTFRHAGALRAPFSRTFPYSRIRRILPPLLRICRDAP